MITMPHFIKWESPMAKRIAAVVVMLGFIGVSIACCVQPPKTGVYDSTATIDKGACPLELHDNILICNVYSGSCKLV